jgi:hypothetical protein
VVVLSIGALVSVALLFVANYCSSVGATYAAVTDPASIWPSAMDTFTTRYAFALSVPDYEIRDGKLYLKVQVTRPSMLLVTFVSFGHWDAEKVQRLRSEHPELEPYWPTGGVRWIPRK